MEIRMSRDENLLSESFFELTLLARHLVEKVAANKVARINLFGDKRKLLITGAQAVSFRIPQPYLSLSLD